MKITKLKIKNLFGIKETELDGRSVELSGVNGAGKSSVIDSIRFALENSSKRNFIIRQGESEGEVLLETDTGLYVNRKVRESSSPYKSVKQDGREVNAPEALLKSLFTPLQLDPVTFISLDSKEQNRMILDLIDFDWDLEWIKNQFGEIPSWVNYDQNILQVLNDIQSENGEYFKHRQDINRDIRNNKAMIEDIAIDIPAGYNYEFWSSYDIGQAYKRLSEIEAHNAKIEQAKSINATYQNKLRGIQAEYEIAVSAIEKEVANTRENLLTEIERLKEQINTAEFKLKSLDETLNNKKEIVKKDMDIKISELNGTVQEASKYLDMEVLEVSELRNDIDNANTMIRHLNEYNRMVSIQRTNKELQEQSTALTQKIELARTLPGTILENASIPVEGLTVKDGIPLINGLPISNLSDGEKLQLCVDVALSKPNNLQLILLDGVERLSDDNKNKLYQKCKEKGLQFIATRTTNENEMEINYL